MSDRVIGVKVCNNSYNVEIVLRVYMPFYNGGGSPDRLLC